MENKKLSLLKVATSLLIFALVGGAIGWKTAEFLDKQQEPAKKYVLKNA